MFYQVHNATICQIGFTFATYECEGRGGGSLGWPRHQRAGSPPHFLFFYLLNPVKKLMLVPSCDGAIAILKGILTLPRLKVIPPA